MGTWEGGWDGLASAVRVRLPSMQSARLQQSPSAAPFAHPALDAPACASRSHLISDLKLEREQLWRIALRSPMRHRILRRTAERDPDGRTLLARQSENHVVSETKRENSSDLANPGLDHAKFVSHEINSNRKSQPPTQ